MTNAAAWYLDRHSENGNGAAICLWADGNEVSYGELLALAQRAGGLLRAEGVQAGDRVVAALPDGPAAVACVLGAMRLGAVAVPLSHRTDGTELARLVAHCEASAAILAQPPGIPVGCPTFLETDLAAAEPLRDTVSRTPADTALIQYTSGSTGRPKGVVHTHAGLLALPHTTGGRIGLTSADRCFSTPKLSFGYGFGNSVLLPLAAGASSVLSERPADPFAVAHVLETARPTVFFSVPTLYAALLGITDAAARLDFAGVRRCVVGGEGLHAELVRRCRETFGIELVNALGSTECLHIVLTSAPGETDLGTPVPGVEVKVLDEHGAVPAAGTPGEAYVRGPLTGVRYWNEESAGTFRDGWVRTGDVLAHEDGVWRHLGRTDDVINVGGFKVAPVRVEQCLLEHEAVRACAVTGVTTGEFELSTVVAHVVPDGDLPDLDRLLRKHVRDRLPAQERPSRYVFTDELPTTPTGKIARARLRELTEAMTVRNEA